MPLSARARRGALCLLPALLLGCAQLRQELPGSIPALAEQSFAQGRGALRRLAIMPFHPAASLPREDPAGGPGAADVAELVTRLVSDALAARGIVRIPAADLVMAFQATGLPAPRQDPREAARVAHQSFGASGVLLGQVFRYRDRTGQALGSDRPASVAFELTLHEAPSGFKLWSGRFDETQKPLSENVFNARRYPGGGTRWLTALELARWGAGAAADALERRARP